MEEGWEALLNDRIGEYWGKVLVTRQVFPSLNCGDIFSKRFVHQLKITMGVPQVRELRLPSVQLKELLNQGAGG